LTTDATEATEKAKDKKGKKRRATPKKTTAALVPALDHEGNS
jgi:hypothetical protein